MTKLLHLADAHLGGAVWGRTRAQRSRLRNALRTAFERAVDCALNEDVDVLLVAGDLYEREHLSLDVEQFLIAQLQRLHDAGIPVVAGVSAPAFSETESERLEPIWPPSFHGLGGHSPALIDLSGASVAAPVRIVSASADDPAWPERAHDSGVPTVGLLYADDRDAAGRLIGSEVLSEAGCAYAALGGAHRRQQAAREPPAWYAGSLMGRRPEEAGQRGGLLVTMEPGEPTEVAPRNFAPLTWKRLRFSDLREVDSRDALRRRALERLPIRRSGLMLHFILEGPCPLARALSDPSRRREWEGPLADRLGVGAVCLETANLTFPADPASYRKQVNVLAETLALIEEADEDERYKLRPALLAGCPEGMEKRAYLRRLLDGLSREATERLVADSPPETSDRSI